MNYKDILLKTVLTSTTVLTLLSHSITSVEAETEIINEVSLESDPNNVSEGKNKPYIEKLEINYIEDGAILSGLYLANEELAIKNSEVLIDAVTTDDEGNFKVEIEQEKLEGLEINILNQNQDLVFQGKIFREENIEPKISVTEVTTEFISGTVENAEKIQVETNSEEIITIPITDDNSFTIKFSNHDINELANAFAINADGDLSEKINLTNLILNLKHTNDLESKTNSKAEDEMKNDDNNETVDKKQGSKNENTDNNSSDERNSEARNVESAESDKTVQPRLMLAATSVGTRNSDRKGTMYHYVQSGETLTSIAEVYGTTVENLQEWNNISNPSSIKVGSLYSVNGYNVYDDIDQEDVTFTTTSSFINYIAPYAEDIAEEHGLYTSVMIAQAIHESAWGKSDLAKIGNNLFGIKGSYNGNSVVMLTWEEINGREVWVQDDFRFYPSYYESIIDNADKLRNGVSWDSSYYRGAWVENTASHFDATEWLTGRYATDSAYASKINRTIKNNNLTRFDKHIDITNPIISQKYLDRAATVAVPNENIYSQPYGTASDQLVGNTSDYLGQRVQISQEKTNDLGTWWLLSQNDEKIGWVLTDTLSDIDYVVTNTNNKVRYTGTIVRPWSINTKPWGTEGAVKAADVNNYLNKVVNVTEEKTTDKGTYAYISIDGEGIGWIDKTAIYLNDEIREVRNVNYSAKVIKPWSINTEPWGTQGYEKVASGQDYLGETVDVIQEKVTDRSTYALVSLNGKEIGWIDVTGLEKHTVVSTDDVSYVAEITRPWSINSEPWGTEGYQGVASGADYLGEVLNVIQEKETNRSTYLLLQKDGKTIGWIDQTGVKKHKDIKKSRTTNYAAKVIRPWSINTQPWGTNGFQKVYNNSSQFVGKTVMVTGEQLTDRSLYALIELDGEELGWIDTTGLEKQEVLSVKDTNYQAEIVKTWSINSRPWGVEGFKANHETATEFMNQVVTVTQEKVTPRSTYALLTLNNKTLGWIDKDALNLYPILSTENVQYKAVITKPWSINTKPWGTDGYKTVINNDSYVGKTVDIVQEQVTPRSTYVLIEENGERIGWIDTTGIQKIEVLETTDTKYAAKITKPWSINSQPWGTPESEKVLDGAELVGETVIITQEKVTPRSTYALITIDEEEIGWIDVTGIEEHKVLATKNVSYSVRITQPWSINTKPWGVEGYHYVRSAAGLLNQTVNVVQEQKTNRSTYLLLELDGKVIGWIDTTGTKRNE